MSVFDLYSKRRKRATGNDGKPDIVVYDSFPQEFRVQVCYLIDDALGDEETANQFPASSRAYEGLVQILRREYGVTRLVPNAYESDYRAELQKFVLQEANVDRVLDAIEWVPVGCRKVAYPHDRGEERAAEFTEELNARFKEHGLGYQLESDEIIRTDSKLLHEDVIRPALLVLTAAEFKGAEEELLEAFEHHRHGREKDALVWALKALESTLKVVCGKRGWPTTGQAKDLLDTVFTRGLIEPLWQSEFGGLRSVLESGVPTARNKLAGHGQGAKPTEVPAYLAAFVLHQTAAAILFLVAAHKAKP